ncbi:MAG: DNA polymerase/3'-5' exonuclease PolX [Planctomycetota bacterium]
MGFNAEVAARFERAASILELLGESRFRVNAYSKAARVIGDHATDLGAIAGDAAKLAELDGVGKSTAEKIGEFAETGTIRELDELESSVPEGLPPLLGISGLGPKTLKLLWEQLGVTDLESLKRELDGEAIASLKGMGKKSVEKIRESLRFAERAGGRLHLGLAMPIAERLVGLVEGVGSVTRAAFAGSLRRGRETIGDIDILAATDEPAAAHAALREAPGVLQVIGSGDRKTSVRVTIPTDAGRWRGILEEDASVQVDLRTVEDASWGAALMYFTGSKAHNVKMRERAIARGMTLNEYGLFEESEAERRSGEPPQSRGATPVAGASEESIYRALELAWVPPELREDRGELELGETPRLIELDDVRAELHAHTTASDGRMELDELASRARDRGFHTLAVTDHSRSSVQANGLSVERLREQRAAIEALEIDGISVLAGSEVDILKDGDLDYTDEVLAELDVVVASPHAALTQDTKTATRRLLRAIEHPMVHIIGHPTGRIISRRGGLEPAMDEIIAAAVEHDTALEVNAHWLRLDLRDTHVAAAVEAGALIAIDCDVHAPEDFDNLRYGVLTARRGGLTSERCINCWPEAELHAWLRSKR